MKGGPNECMGLFAAAEQVRASAAATVAALLDGAPQRAYLAIAECRLPSKQPARCTHIPVHKFLFLSLTEGWALFCHVKQGKTWCCCCLETKQVYARHQRCWHAGHRVDSMGWVCACVQLSSARGARHGVAVLCLDVHILIS